MSQNKRDYNKELNASFCETQNDIIEPYPNFLQKNEEIPKIRVIKDDNFDIKSWPMMDDSDDNLTNALGYPLFGGKKIEEEREEREDLEPEADSEAEEIVKSPVVGPTVAELEQITEDAFNKGFSEGKSKGFAQGLLDGKEQGHEEGVNLGRQEGQKLGYDDGYKAGFEKGQQEGFNQGNAQGLQNGEQVVSAQVQRFRHLADALASPLRNLDEEVLDELVYMVSRLCKVILKEYLPLSEDTLKATILKATSLLAQNGKGASLEFNPDDLSVAISCIGREYMQAQKWQFTENPELSPGDVKVVLGKSQIKILSQERIDELLEKFLLNAKAAKQHDEKTTGVDINADNEDKDLKALEPDNQEIV